MLNLKKIETKSMAHFVQGPSETTLTNHYLTMTMIALNRKTKISMYKRKISKPADAWLIQVSGDLASLT